ncbi:hypothetical protein BGX23_009751 [Mortierella sp. AD031]|nr:hypothetical protein BGX23_009751 [Mortierella sp. AD031]
MALTSAILSRVGLFLNVDSCLRCISVCKQWRDIFTPCLWHTVDNRTWEAMTVNSVHSSRFQGGHIFMAQMFKEHKESIRVLTLSHHTMLYAARLAGLTDLVSLTLDSPEGMSIDDYQGSEALDCWFDGDEVQETLFQPLVDSAAVMNLTRAYWQVVLMNPGLVRLTFKVRHLRFILPLAVVKPTDPGSLRPAVVLTLESTAFLTNILPRLQSLRHMDVGQNADEFLFINLATGLPNLQSFVHSEYSQFDPEALLLHPHHNLRHLVFRIASLSAEQLRAVVATFPALCSLSVPECYISKEEIIEADLWQELVHPSLTRMSIDDPSGLLQSRVKFPNVRTVNVSVFLPNNLGLQRFLKVFPLVGQLEARRVNSGSREVGNDEEEFEVQSEHRIPRPCLIKTLVAYNVWSLSDRIDRVFSQMDFLVRLDVDWIGPRALKVIGRVCKSLEYARFDLRTRCSQELVGLFIGCPKLKECLGHGHAILADDIIGSAEWTCIGIKKLEIDVVGVLRLSLEEETTLSTWRLVGNSFMSDKEQDAMDLQLFSYAIQRQVYERLGRLKELEEICFGPHSSPKQATGVVMGDYLWSSDSTQEGLELTLSSGLAELGALDKLQQIGFEWAGQDQGLGEAEVAWVLERWSMEELWGRRRNLRLVDW